MSGYEQFQAGASDSFATGVEDPGPYGPQKHQLQTLPTFNPPSSTDFGTSGRSTDLSSIKAPAGPARTTVSGGRPRQFAQPGAPAAEAQSSGGRGFFDVIASGFSALGYGFGMITDALFRGFSSLGNLFSPSWWGSLGRGASPSSGLGFERIILDYTPVPRDEAGDSGPASGSRSAESKPASAGKNSGGKPSGGRRGGGGGAAGGGAASKERKKRS